MQALAKFLPDGIGVGAALLLAIASFFTSALTATFGVGGGVAMLALMGLFVPVAALIPVHGTVPFIMGSVVGAIAGAFLVVQLPDALLKLVLAVFIIAITWAKIPGIDRLGKAGLVVASTGLALLSMFVGATGPLVSVILAQILANDRKALVATHAAAMTVQHGLKIVVFGLAGFAFWNWLPLIAAMIAFGFLGTVYGTRLLDRLPEESFRRWFKIGITILALELLWQGLDAAF